MAPLQCGRQMFTIDMGLGIYLRYTPLQLLSELILSILAVLKETKKSGFARLTRPDKH